MRITVRKIAGFLDETLKAETFQDVSNNGLQLENDGTVTHIAAGVDLSLRFLTAASEQGADFVICHHGLSWGDSLKRITGLNHQLVSFALANNIAIYASHLPLDAHPEFGNNARLAAALGLGRLQPAFTYHGNTIGCMGHLDPALTLGQFAARLRKTVRNDVRSLAFGRKTVRTVGIVSGAASDMVDQAAELGVDLFVTGEAGLQGYILAENLGMNVLFAGHYATETLGVRALAKEVTKTFGLPATFIDFGIPF